LVEYSAIWVFPRICPSPAPAERLRSSARLATRGRATTTDPTLEPRRLAADPPEVCPIGARASSGLPDGLTPSPLVPYSARSGGGVRAASVSRTELLRAVCGAAWAWVGVRRGSGGVGLRTDLMLPRRPANASYRQLSRRIRPVPPFPSRPTRMSTVHGFLWVSRRWWACARRSGCCVGACRKRGSSRSRHGSRLAPLPPRRVGPTGTPGPFV
jgi:hypothetical protein